MARLPLEFETPDDPPLRSPSKASTPSARPRVGIFASVQVNVAENGGNILGDAANEPAIAVDPMHPNRMAIGWRQFDNVLSNFRQAGVAYSDDSGRTWHFRGVLDPGQFRSDPVLAFDAQGRFYYSSLKANFMDLSCDLFVSGGGGTSWSGPIYAYGGDKQWLAVDRTSGAGEGNLYSAWSDAAGCCGQNTFTRSVDGGASFSLPSSIPSRPHWGSMDVGPDGTLYVAGIDGLVPPKTLMAKSASASDPAASPIFESVRSVPLGGRVVVPSGGPTPNPDGLLGQVWIAVDPSSGPSSGHVYLLASVDPPGADPLDVLFTRSADRGATWSAPVRLNDDAPGAWQWFGTMSVAPNGRIDVVWNDTRNTGAANRSELYYVSSNDGGITWSPNQRISPEWDSYVGWPNQSKIGDYYQMVSDRVGANLAWSATFNGEQDVWFLRIGDYDCNGNGVGDATDIARGTSTDWNRDGIPDECQELRASDVAASFPATFRLLQNVPNPFHPSAAIAFDAAGEGGSAVVQIHDVAGRLVRTLEGPVAAGRNALLWDGTDSHGRPLRSGVYLYRLVAPHVTASRRMVLAR